MVCFEKKIEESELDIDEESPSKGTSNIVRGVWEDEEGVGIEVGIKEGRKGKSFSMEITSLLNIILWEPKSKSL